VFSAGAENNNERWRNEMKAAVFYGPGDMRVEEVPLPECPPGGALVKLSGSMICGSDIKIYNNGHPNIKPPHITGHESCGRLVEMKAEIPGIKIGDRVTVQTSIPCGSCNNCHRGWFNICENLKGISQNYNGVFAEYVAIPEQAVKMGNLIKAPDSLTDEEVCLSEPLACVINGQDFLSIKPGENVLIIGAGPIGILHAELAKYSGARVIIAEKSPSRLEMAKGFSYSAYIDTGKYSLVKETLSLTNGSGADVAIVTAPVREAMEQAVEALDFRGRLSFFGSLKKGDSNITIDSRPIHYKELMLYGASSSGTIHMKRALGILAGGVINSKGIVTHRLPLNKIVEGIKLGIEGKGIKVYLDNSL
jgi:L-iditol 2-dehydrogenase